MSGVGRLVGSAVWLAAVAAAACGSVYLVFSLAPGASACESRPPGLLSWAVNVLQGDFGLSDGVDCGDRVAAMLWRRVPKTMVVLGWAFVVLVPASGFLAWMWRRYRGTWWATLSQFAVYVASAAPVFIVAHWMIEGVNQGNHLGPGRREYAIVVSFA